MEKYRLLAPIDFWPYTYGEKYPNLYYTQILNPLLLQNKTYIEILLYEWKWNKYFVVSFSIQAIYVFFFIWKTDIFSNFLINLTGQLFIFWWEGFLLLEKKMLHVLCFHYYFFSKMYNVLLIFLVGSDHGQFLQHCHT